jgi:hypothetical protein
VRTESVARELERVLEGISFPVGAVIEQGSDAPGALEDLGGAVREALRKIELP